jgi:hypothetical protein
MANEKTYAEVDAEAQETKRKEHNAQINIMSR